MPDGLEVVRFTCGPFDENPYLLIGPSRQRAALVDPGIESEAILEEIRRLRLTLEWIVNTHGHVDHAAGNAFFRRETGALLAIHGDDLPLLRALDAQASMWGLRVEPSPEPDLLLDESEPFAFDGLAFEVLHTPGHTPGGVCLLHGDRMLVGDTLFRGSVGRTDLPGGSWPVLEHSIREKLFRLPDATACLPGHGPTTTIGVERRTNPWVSAPDRVAAVAE